MIKSIDRASLIFCLFLFSLLWCKFFIKSLIFALISASIICFVLTVVVMFLLDKRQNKKLLTKQQNKSICAIQDFFKYNSKEKIKDTFKKKLQVEFFDENMFVYKENIYYLMLKEVSSEHDILDLLKQNANVKKINIITPKFSEEIHKFCDNLLNIEINLIDAKQLLLNYNLNVDCEVNDIRLKQKNKIKFMDFLLLFVNEKNFKGYIFAGCVLLFSSLLIRQKLYYYIIASILFLLAFLCKFLAKIKVLKK